VTRWRRHIARPSAGMAREDGSRAQRERSVLVPRDRDAPTAAHGSRRGPPPEEGDFITRTAHSALVSRDRNALVAAHGAAERGGPLPARL
jgi:hypothetical protein